MNHEQCKTSWRSLLFVVAAGTAVSLAGCSGGPILESSPIVRTLNLPIAWRRHSEERKLRKAVEADSFPCANEDGL